MPMIRSPNEWSLGRGVATIADVFKVLDRLEAIQQSCAFWRRIFLYRLAEHRDRLLERAQERRNLDTRVLRPRGSGKVETEVIDDLIEKIYPHTVTQRRDLSIEQWRDRHMPERKKISNRLHVARNWKRAAQRFHLGIFLLIPCGGQSRVQNYVYESLHDDELQALYDGENYPRRLSLEDVDNISGESMSPARILELCGSADDT
ncbi:hypothetical protein LTR96_011096 [Exophiala xenobiotica]|nr:hypothetical protein LTR96_011096 [Exophiala xenobiotica]